MITFEPHPEHRVEMDHLGLIYRELVGSLGQATRIARNEPMAKRTTLRVGGPADIYIEPADESDLGAVIRFCQKRALPLLILGRGSNLIVKDHGIRGVVVNLGQDHFQRLDFDGEWVTCGAGARLKSLAMKSRKAGLTGFEFAEGIPGTVGGAMRMNAGAMGSSFFDVLYRFRFMDRFGEIHDQLAEATPVEYRSCRLLKECVALEAVLRGRHADDETIEQRLKASGDNRKNSQPAASSAGCMFKNATCAAAGKLIDELGLKGTRVGGAMISEVHGNFIINRGGATAAEVLELIRWTQSRVMEERGIALETEVEIVGE